MCSGAYSRRIGLLHVYLSYFGIGHRCDFLVVNILVDGLEYAEEKSVADDEDIGIGVGGRYVVEE